MNLNQAFKAIKPAIGKGALLTSVKIEASANRMTLTASNLTFTLSAAAEYAGNPFTCCASGKLLGDALDKLEKPDIAFSDARLILTKDLTRIAIATSSAEDFPTDKECADIVEIDAHVGPHLARVFYAAGHDDVRYYLNGVALQGSAAGIAAVATDGHRLAVSRTDAEVDSFEIIIPRESAKALIALDPQRLVLGLEDGIPKHLMAERGDTHLTTVLVDGKFVEWRKVLPNHHEAISINRADLVEKLGILKPFSGTSGVHMTVAENMLRMHVSDAPDTASADCSLPCTGSETLEAAFNVAYLVEALQGITTEDAIIMHGESAQSIRLDDGDYSAVLSPMRI